MTGNIPYVKAWDVNHLDGAGLDVSSHCPK